MSALPPGYDAWRTESGYELSYADERRANRVEAILGQQETATARLRSIALRAKAEIEALDFPLGSPVKGYDLEDVIAMLDDCAKPVEPDEQRAWDLVREDV